jgi:hypothetical protein
VCASVCVRAGVCVPTRVCENEGVCARVCAHVSGRCVRECVCARVCVCAASVCVRGCVCAQVFERVRARKCVSVCGRVCVRASVCSLHKICPHSYKPTRFASNPNPNTNPTPNPRANSNGANRVGFPGKSGPGQITTGQTRRSPVVQGALKVTKNK